MTDRPRIPAALVTDLYELTMAAAYVVEGMEHEATFELFVRRLPAERRFLVAAGLDDALAGLESFAFAPHEVDYLAGLELFPEPFVERLSGLRFTGDVWAVPEGEMVFAGEPIVQVTAPLVEAQLVETFLLNAIASRTMLASKAARVGIACGDRSFVDFSARRDHGVDAAMAAARGAWICGAAGTSLVAAGQRWGIPLSGTMAHSFVMSFDEERDAFRAYARSFPKGTVLLIDTYDTVEGARRAAEVAHELAGDGIHVGAVRIDSGDLGRLAVEVRAVLDGAGLTEVQILASGDLDEHRIADLLAAGAPIDAFGVGTQLGTSGDAPSLGAVYKLVEDAQGPQGDLALRRRRRARPARRGRPGRAAAARPGHGGRPTARASRATRRHPRALHGGAGRAPAAPALPGAGRRSVVAGRFLRRPDGTRRQGSPPAGGRGALTPDLGSAPRPRPERPWDRA